MSTDNSLQVPHGDAGLNNEMKKTHHATQVDEGWRAAANSERQAPSHQATQMDAGWRAAAGGGHQATQVDEGWRRTAADMLDPNAAANAATANAFLTIDEFKAAMVQLPTLTTTTGKVYHIKGALSTEGGESVVLLCADDEGHDMAAKVYYEPVNGAGSSVAARTHVLEYMGTDEGRQYTLAVTEIGLVKDFGNSTYYFEIMPYCKDGDLSGKGALSFSDLVIVIRQMNEALHSIHKARILHRDIKPENIYLYQNRVVLGDFGIARLANLKATGITAGTYGYQAPETQLAVSSKEAVFFFDERCDYYSLGVTIATLYEGHFVYEDMDINMVTRAYQRGKLPLKRTDEHREHIEHLVDGLCKFDPTYRFGYEDVKRWLEDYNYTGGSIGEEWPRALHLLRDQYQDEQSMFYGITKDEEHWNEAKSMLYKRYFEQFFMSFRTDLARAAQTSEELYRSKDSDKGLAIFLKTLFAPGPLVWRGYTYKSLSDLAGHMLWPGHSTVYKEMLQSQCISHWLDNTEGITVNRTTRDQVAAMEKLAATDPDLACYWFGNTFCDTKTVRMGRFTVHSLEELFRVMFSSPNNFYDNCYDMLVDRREGAALYGFLYSYGYREIIDKEWEPLDRCDLFHKVSMLLFMLDTIACKAGIDPAPVRNFFVNYGPVGIATCTRQLVSASPAVYRPLDAAGRQILSRIEGFKAPADGTVSELFRAYSPLVDLVGQLQRHLVENPFSILTGVYDSQGVICANLTGTFAYRIFDRMAPLGFQALISGTNGGNKA